MKEKKRRKSGARGRKGELEKNFKVHPTFAGAEGEKKGLGVSLASAAACVDCRTRKLNSSRAIAGNFADSDSIL